MKAYSIDLRQRIVSAYEQGEGSIAEVASRFGVCPAFIKKMLRQWRTSGDLSPRPHGGGKPKSLSGRQQQLLRRKVRAESDITLAELQSFLAEQESVEVHVSTISRPLCARPAAQEKSLVAGERNDYKRGWYRRRLSAVDHRRLRFIDEAGVNLAMTRLRGRAPRGERVRESVPRNYDPQTSLIGALSLRGVEAVMTVEWAVDTEVFDAYLELVLGPRLRRGDVLVLDNLGAHRASRIVEVAESRGAQVLWLAPYSPDFSPIEQCWSKIKTYLRGAKARTGEELNRGLAQTIGLVTKADIRGWFRHCGYSLARK